MEEVSNLCPSISAGIPMVPLTIEIFAEFVLLLMFLFLSALVSASEVSFFSISKENLKTIESRKSANSKLVISHINNPEKLLASLLTAKYIVNISIIILSVIIINTISNYSPAPIIGLLAQIVVLVILLLLFGEILPKNFAWKYPMSLSVFMAFPIHLIIKIFYPLNYFFLKYSKVTNRRLPYENHELSMTDLSEALDLASNTIDEDKKILKGIVNFGNIQVTDIMKPRIDVVALEIGTRLSKVISVIVDSGYSRIPVYSNTFDDVRGILYVKDLLPHINKGETFKWQTLLRVPYFVPETKRINDLLKDFQCNKIHMTIVVDEYGGTAGIVTLEDILEEIVGEIIDDFDFEKSSYTKIDNSNYLFEGKTPLIDFYRIMQLNENIFDQVKGDADTIAGLILEIKGEIPEKNSVITYKNFEFVVESADRRRIKKIKVRVRPS